MPAIFCLQHTVTDDEIDGHGHVNNLVYMRWMQTAAIEHSAEQGWPAERYTETEAGWVVRTHFVEYFQPAFVDEKIEVLTWVSNFKKITSLRKYRVVRPADQKLLASAETDWAFIGLKQGVPRRIPPELSSAFETVALEDEPRDFKR